jgi:hypothetical protein
LGRGAHVQSRCLHGLKVVMWVTLKMLSFECKPLQKKILTHTENILGENPNSHNKQDLWFYVVIKHGWVSMVGILWMNMEEVKL